MTDYSEISTTCFIALNNSLKSLLYALKHQYPTLILCILSVRYISVVYTFGSSYHGKKDGDFHGDTQENTINSSPEKRDM